jgi:hypothetical protein
VKNPRYTEAEIWQKLLQIDEQKIPSLDGNTWHTIIEQDETKQRYKIQYPRRYTAWVHLTKLYTLYCEVYAVGSITKSYMDEHCGRLLNRKTWQVPGGAMLAILPLLDDAIRVERGALVLRTED